MVVGVIPCKSLYIRLFAFFHSEYMSVNIEIIQKKHYYKQYLKYCLNNTLTISNIDN